MGKCGFLVLLLITALVGCSALEQAVETSSPAQSYHQISQDEAKRMMEQDDGHVIVDVRR